MKIINDFSQKEIKMLKEIDVNIEEKEYTSQGIEKLSDIIYKECYMNVNLTYMNYY